MNCKNCGARLKDDAKVCQNCGAFIDDGSGYVLLTDNYKTEDVYSDINPEPEKKGSGVRFFISLILVIAIVGAGAYYYFTNIYKPDDKPPLSFTCGSGIINDDETVIYVGIPESSRIEFIHGVALYDYDKTTSKSKVDPVSTGYEYTKSIDGSFRTIFFNVDNSVLDDTQNYSYTFEMKFSFADSQDIYTYQQVVAFDGNITENISDIIFDHSLDEEPVITTSSSISETSAKPDTTTSTTTTTTTKKAVESTAAQNIGYIYNSFWFTQPISEGTNYDISAIKFNSNGTYTETHYHKQGNKNWATTTIKGKYEVKQGAVFTTDSEGQTQSYPVDSNAKTLEGLTGRRYNSVKNAEDFFGL